MPAPGLRIQVHAVGVHELERGTRGDLRYVELRMQLAKIVVPGNALPVEPVCVFDPPAGWVGFLGRTGDRVSRDRVGHRRGHVVGARGPVAGGVEGEVLVPRAGGRARVRQDRERLQPQRVVGAHLWREAAQQVHVQHLVVGLGNQSVHHAGGDAVVVLQLVLGLLEHRLRVQVALHVAVVRVEADLLGLRPRAALSLPQHRARRDVDERQRVQAPALRYHARGQAARVVHLVVHPGSRRPRTGRAGSARGAVGIPVLEALLGPRGPPQVAAGSVGSERFRVPQRVHGGFPRLGAHQEDGVGLGDAVGSRLLVRHTGPCPGLLSRHRILEPANQTTVRLVQPGHLVVQE
mmetsp:Transcript_17256/g.42815  ORF Transcript_17256/g.42815 Transcript_17256/m.42815 type:complete len:349 (-) Transcript_17256:794-1840(-)